MVSFSLNSTQIYLKLNLYLGPLRRRKHTVIIDLVGHAGHGNFKQRICELVQKRLGIIVTSQPPESSTLHINSQSVYQSLALEI
jgi:hypothetical protein